MIKYCKISEICKIFSGNSINEKIKKEKYSKDKDGIEYISTKDIGYNLKINYKNGVKIPHGDLDKFRIAPSNTVFICAEGGSAGRKLAISDRQLCFVNKLFAIVSSEKVLPKFIFYFIQSENFNKQFKSAITGLIGGVSLNKFKEFEIPILPILVQQRIVAKLDKIFAVIEKTTGAAEANAKNAEALFQSYLTKVFECNRHGWIEKKLKEITTKIGSGATPKGGNESYKETGISLVRSMNVYDDGFYYPKLAFIDDNQAKELNNVTVEEHDVLLNITGASVSRCCLVPPEILPARVNQHVSILRAIKSIINPKLLHLLLISPLHKKKLLSVGEGGGTTRQAITKAQLQEYVISFPVSQISQNKLIEKISELYSFIVKIKKTYEKKITNLALLKQSILQQAFSSELFKVA